ncbi:MAG: tetratricopeptide repeat protein [Sphingomonadales bacterium]|nr:tetratricopeptide repeat protein [Sphingomonadales bacterium]MDE2568524.1 tetratricopeptide repeat protein [Sphingomonadales bacterium]
MALRPDNSKARSNQLAERKALQEDVFLREVDDALREDQMVDAFRRYGKPVGALVAAGLVALGGYLWYDNHKSGLADTRGEEMVKALDTIEANDLVNGNRDLLPLAKDGGGYGAAAKLLEAGVAQQGGKSDQAAKIFAEVAADTSAPQAYRDLATVREVAAGFDKMKPEDVVARLKPLAVPGNPWFGPAGEMVGVAYMKMGKNDLAGPLFAALSKDKDVSETLRRRTRQLAGLLGVDAIDDPGKTAEQGLAQDPGQ